MRVDATTKVSMGAETFGIAPEAQETNQAASAYQLSESSPKDDAAPIVRGMLAIRGDGPEPKDPPDKPDKPEKTNGNNSPQNTGHGVNNNASGNDVDVKVEIQVGPKSLGGCGLYVPPEDRSK